MYNTFKHCQQQLDGIQSIDYFLARELCNALQAAQDDLLFHSIMAVSQALRGGHTCLKLDEEASNETETPYWHNADEDITGYTFPKFNDWHQHLSQLAISPTADQPLVYERKRLYLRRYWQFENELGEAVRDLINCSMVQQQSFDIARAQRVIEQLFPLLDPAPVDVEQAIDPEEQNEEQHEGEKKDWQKIAVANALIHQFTIIAGGPGTGKTFTVTKVLAALQMLNDKQVLNDNQLKIALTAPTGKAAQRLNESIQKAKAIISSQQLAAEAVLDSIPDTACTVHRLLGVIPGSHDFRYNKDRKLPFDVILVDEISMIDLPLMTRLIRAIDQNCRIIMLGDADQLPSVAAGSVLSDLAPRQAAGYTDENSRLLSELSGFDIPLLGQNQDAPHDKQLNLDYLTVLQKSHRFDGSGEIGNLAKYVISGDAENSWTYLEQAEEQIERVKGDSIVQWIDKMVDQYYVPLFLRGKSLLNIEQAFEQLKQFRFLAAIRLGEQGVTNINDTIERLLRNKGLISSSSEFYPGRPIMVTENHYNTGLYNGDTGLLWLNEEGKLQAAFPDNNSVRWLSLGRLPRIETVYAMTIHKTQGSEFAHVGLVLPEMDSLILSRELLYTGITRASKKLSIFSAKKIFELGVQRRVQRYSGLQEKVFGSS